MLIDPDAAQAKARAAKVQAQAITDPRGRGLAVATAEWLEGEALLRSSDSAKAVVPISNALSLAASLAPSSKLHADIFLTRGGLVSDQGNAGEALKDYQAAFKIYAKLGDARGQAMALLFISGIYTEALDQASALKYSKQALDIYKLDPNLSVSIYNNRGVAFDDLRQHKQAIYQYEQALSLAKGLRSANLQAQILSNMARTYLLDGNLTAADEAIDRGLGFATGLDVSGPRAELTATAAQAALQRGNVSQAVDLIKRAFSGIDPAQISHVIRDFHKTAYNVFLASGDDKAALVHLQALKRLDDNATKLATSTKNALMSARFDFANQELKISQLKASELQRSIAFERARAETQRYVFLGAAAAVAVVIAMLAFGIVTLRRSRDQVRAANADLAVTNSALGKALAAKTEFLATTSHEIRTPLNGILGMTEVMLADPKLSPTLRDRLDVVHGAGVTMRALVDDILDVAKMETGNLTIESAPFDLRATVAEATRMWDEQARAKGLSFAVDLGGCPGMIMGDAARIRQIVFNLLSNALKFTRAGRVTLAIDVGDDDRLRVAVTDSGIGIPAEKLEDIFESFRQADAGTTRQFGGTGLGLSICRNLARAMGGDVSVTSVVGQGTVFTLSLPLVRVASVDVAQSDDDSAARSPVTLVLDRNPITRSMFKTLLAPRCGPVACVVSVDDAVARLAAGNVSRMLIDDATIRAGGDHRAALAQLVAAAGPERVETTLLWPIAADQERDELLATGITRVVAKPVSGGALVAAMLAKPISKNNAIPDLVPYAA
ncbi:ATP-binding protein [Sphingomonas sp. 4RDLI-65]|uniref:ATP-binding protein n=1 Tax=Sphingomonas sp. 4RDLI-65 TaxID=3111641 RepID=UPI003C180725